MELGDYLRTIRKRWILILAMMVLGLAVGASVTLLTTPKYIASTLVFVSVPSASSAGDLASGSSFVQNQIASYAEVVSTPRVLDSVISGLNLDVTAAHLAESVTAKAPLSTVNIEIDVSQNSPQEAVAVANSVTDNFIKAIDTITTPPSGGASQVSVSILRNATIPLGPSSPNLKIDLGLGIALGLALGLAIAFLIELLDTLIRGERDVATITTSPIIGGLMFDATATKNPLIVHDSPHSVRSEAFRTLRTNLQFLDTDSGSKSFVITSSIPSEGKTTTAANLAIALSDSGVRVVIIDGDLRRPKLASYLGLEGAVGLSDVLISRVSLEDALQTWGRGGLSVLPAGSIPPNPSELLGSQAMTTLLSTLEQHFDVVLVDSPPLLPVTDAALVSKLVHGTLVVVAAGRTHKGEFAAALASLENVGAPVAGIIMTMLPTKGSDSYGNYGYGQYGYTEQVNPPKRERAVKVEKADKAEKAPVKVTSGLDPNWGNGASTVRK